MMSFCIKTLGCKVNTYESEYIHSLFVKKGFLWSEENADIYIINTCTVTNMSDRKSRQIINSIRESNPKSIIIVCGCYSQNAYQTEKLNNIDADIIIGNKDKSKIIEYLDEYLKHKNKISKFYNLKNTEFENMEISSKENRTRAFVKIEDGCNNFCTYCIIPYVRGNVRSKEFESIIKEVTALVTNGHKEIVLTGIHTGAYNDGTHDFADLLEELIKTPNLLRLRISSIEINELNNRVLEIIKNSKILVPHLHVPLQSGSEEILKQMNRKYNKAFFKDKINYIRSIKDDISFTTDVIVGFPGETEEMHKESLEFIESIGFTKVHVFPYSDRDGTVASKMTNKVDGNIKKRRVHELLELSKKLENNFYKSYYNKTMEVLIEEEKNGYFTGHTSNFIKVSIQGNYNINKIYNILLTEENIVKSK